ncbi:MAG: site-2 protease family protein [Cyanobacteria bacterium J06641_5]
MHELILQDPIFYACTIAIVIVSIVLHELAHGFAAISQGDRTPIERGHITLNPVVHMGWASLIILCIVGLAWGQMPVRPDRFRDPKWGEAIVAGAGPSMNFVLAVLAMAVLNIVSEPAMLRVFYFAAFVNWQLFFLNLLPVPPLDGFKVFSEIIPGLRSLERSPQARAAVPFLLILGVGRVLSPIARALICLGVPSLSVCF